MSVKIAYADVIGEENGIGQATYSPEDNKLRFYPDSRLSKEDYNRARAAGFKWAPKQELFVAPMWTPDREDLLLEWCGEIGDEDKSLVERAADRAERFEDYSDKRKADADQAHAAVESICEHIPLGQPILVGHHSEKRARKDAERIENGMRKAVKMWEQSQYWADRAKGAIRAAKYKERPDVRARRIKGLEADKRKQERAKAEAEHLIRFWKGELFAKNPQTGERRPIEIKEENRAWLHELTGRMSGCGVRLLGQDGQNYYGAYEIFAPDGERYKNAPIKTVAEVQEAALRIQAGIIERRNRWIAHYENRIAYERAMLAEDGGTVADKTGPEVGGACRCWGSPGYGKGWAYIQKVNKVSVTIHDQADYARADGIKRIFRRIMPFDKLHAIMTKAEVENAKAAGLVVDTHGGTGFYLRETADNTPAPTRDEERDIAHKEAVAAKVAERAKHIEEMDKIRAAHGASSINADTGEMKFEENTNPAQKFDAMKEALKAGVQVVSAPQLFPTPPALAARMVDLAFEHGWSVQIGSGMNDNCRVLEPSAGTGNILRAIGDACEFESNLANVTAVEINGTLAENLISGFPKSDIRRGDFLGFNGELGKFDRIIMNPPFANGADIKHILHAKKMLAEGGRLVAICANGPRQQAELQPLADSWEELPDGTFSEQGTNVRTVLLTING